MLLIFLLSSLLLTRAVVIVDGRRYQGDKISKIPKRCKEVSIAGMNIYTEMPRLPPQVILALDQRQLRVINSFGIYLLSSESQAAFHFVTNNKFKQAIKPRETKGYRSNDPRSCRCSAKVADAKLYACQYDEMDLRLDEEFFSGSWIESLQ